jgi:tetratricopeptide (TPR) repeat protein
MASLEERYDDAMFDFSMGDYAGAAAKLKTILAEDPSSFDAQLSLGMAYCRLGDYAAAIAEGHKAEQMRPGDQLVHTNLSLFYVRAGDKGRAEHHGLQARIASWKGNLAPPPAKSAAESELEVAKPALPNLKIGGSASNSGETDAPPSAPCPPTSTL